MQRISKAGAVNMYYQIGDTINYQFSVMYNNEAVNLNEFTSFKLTVSLYENTEPLLTFSNTGSTYIIDDGLKSEGKLLIESDSLPLSAGHYHYKLIASNADTTTTILVGKFITGEHGATFFDDWQSEDAYYISEVHNNLPINEYDFIAYSSNTLSNINSRVLTSVFNAYTASTTGSSSSTITGATNGLSLIGRNIGLGGTVQNNLFIDPETTGSTLFMLGFLKKFLAINLNGDLVGVGGTESVDLNLNPVADEDGQSSIGINKFNALPERGSFVRLQSDNVSTGGYGVKLVIGNGTGSTTGSYFEDLRLIPKGIEYSDDYSATFTDRSLVDKGFVLNAITNGSGFTASNGITKSGNNIRLGGALTGDTIIGISGASSLSFNTDSSKTFRIRSGGDTVFYAGGSVQSLQSRSGLSRLTIQDGGQVTLRVASGSSMFIDHGTTNRIVLSQSGIGLTIGSDATGDLFYRNSSSRLSRLGIGTANQVLVSTGSIPSWVTFSGNNGITKSGNNYRLGGTLTGATTINALNNSNRLTFGVSPIQYSADYSSAYDNRSLVDNGYVTGLTSLRLLTSTFNSYSASTLTNINNRLIDVMTTRGDLIYRDSSNITSRLARGTADQILKSDGNDIFWSDINVINNSGLTSLAGDVYVSGDANSIYFLDLNEFDVAATGLINLSAPLTNIASDIVLLPPSSYLNFSATGSTGYGIRDNSGTIQFKNNGGSWINIGAGYTAGSGISISGGTINLSYQINAVQVTASTLTLNNTHMGKVIYYTGTGTLTVTVPNTLATGFNCVLMQDNSGVIQLTPSGVTLKGKDATTEDGDIITIFNYATNKFLAK